MGQSDLERWEARYRARSDELAQPLPWLQQNVADLKAGPILDVAGGDGANALYLSSLGFDVTVIDIAPTAIMRLQRQAQTQELAVTGFVHDLDQSLALLNLQPFATILISRYKPSAKQWPHLLELLAPGGRLLICSFGATAEEMPPVYRYRLDELELLFDGKLDLLNHDRLDGGLEGFVFARV